MKSLTGRMSTEQVLHTAFHVTTNTVDPVDNYRIREYLLFIENGHNGSYSLMLEHLCDNFCGTGTPSRYCGINSVSLYTVQ